MIFKNKHDNNEENFWLSATDMMAALSFFFILLLVLAVLFLNTSKDEVFTPLEATEATKTGEFSDEPTERDEGRYLETYATEYVEHDDDSGGGETQAPTEEETETSDLNGIDEGYSPYAAVFVTVVDAETGNAIKKKGIQFELYADKNGIGGLQTLHTYYPEKIEYKKYQTNEKGIFYLPEKISYGWYSLHNLSAPEDYYADGNTDFEIDEGWHWSEPYMVTVSLKPIKNIIRIRAEDRETKEPVKDAVYKITAAEDIKAADGTVRFSAGDKIDEITTDKTGIAQTKELYLGEYNIKQISAPEYYAVSDKAVKASSGKNSDDEDSVVKLDCDKTSVTVRLSDERTEKPIEGAVFSVEGRDDLATDQNGEIVIGQLKKQTTYKLTLTELPDGYMTGNSELTFVVDKDGLVDSKASPVIEKTAYNLCMSAEVKDLFFGRSCAGIDMTLTDENGDVVEKWTTSDNDYIITGLAAGTYYLQQDNDEESRITVEIKNTPELQNVRMRIWDTVDLFAILMLVGAVAIAVIVLVLMINRRKKVSRSK